MTTLSDGVVLTHVTTDVGCILKGIDRDWHGVVIFSSTATYSSMARVVVWSARRGGAAANQQEALIVGLDTVGPCDGQHVLRHLGERPIGDFGQRCLDPFESQLATRVVEYLDQPVRQENQGIPIATFDTRRS